MNEKFKVEKFEETFIKYDVIDDLGKVLDYQSAKCEGEVQWKQKMIFFAY